MASTNIPDEPHSSDPTAGTSAEVRFVPSALADPGPLGLGGFALTTFVLSVYNSGLVDPGSESVVFGLALAYGGLAQLLAGMWEFRTGNTFGAVAFSSFGAFWISYWALVTFYVDKIPPADAGHGIGLFLIAWGIFTAYMTIASLRTTMAIFAVFLLLVITFFLLGIGNAGDHSGLIKTGGWFGIATAIVAWYASFAAVTNATFGRTVIPVGPLNR